MSQRRAQRRALVIGGSMSGLLAAMMLARRGWQVDVFERVESELAGRGAGIVAQPGLIARLNTLGLDTRDLGVEITTRKILDSEGVVIATGVCPQVLTAWERVYRMLRDAFPADRYHRGRGLKAFEQNGGNVVAHFSDGGTAEATCWSAPTGCVRPCGSNACPPSRRFMRATWLGARLSRRAHCRRRST